MSNDAVCVFTVVLRLIENAVIVKMNVVTVSSSMKTPDQLVSASIYVHMAFRIG